MSQIVRLNSIKDAAHRTRLGRSTLYTEMRQGRLRSVKVGSRRLIPEAALVEYINGLASDAALITETSDVDVDVDVDEALVGVEHVA